MRRLFALLLLFFLAIPLHTAAAEAERAGLHYRPAEAIFGDPIPFYHDGVHHVFYLCPDLIVGQKGKSLAWRHLASRDLVHWDILPPAILPDANDKMIATGSIVEKDGVFHAFYTTSKRGAEGAGLPEVRVTTSRDLISWTKELGEPLLLLKRDVPEVGLYDTLKHWRDPHVFWNPDAQQWWLAIAAQEKTSVDYPYAGAVALATSTDLRKWTVQPEPLLSSREGPASECPDVFPLGDGWAMIYYADTSRIRLAPTPRGPWRRAPNDPPWGLHFLASKTEFDGQRRIAHAYIQQSDHDFTRHKYGGTMALPREIYLDDQGAVATRLVSEIIAACKDDATSNRGAGVFRPAANDPVEIKPDVITLAPDTGEAAMAVWEDAPADYFLTADVSLAAGATLDLLLRSSPLEQRPGQAAPNALDDSYILSLDAHRDVVTLKHGDVWNRMPAMRSQAIDLPTTRSFKLHLMLHGDILEVFVDDRISVTARVQLANGALALLARDGRASLDNLRMTHLPE